MHVRKFISMGPVPGDNGMGWIARKEAMTQVTTAEIFEVFMSRVSTRRDDTELKSICGALKAAGWRPVNLGKKGGRVWRSEHWSGNDEQDELF